MKHDKLRGGLDRDRSYWEPARSTFQIEARIEEISVDEPRRLTTSSSGGLVRSAAGNRRVRAAAISTLVLTVVAAVLVGPLSPAHARTAPGPSAAQGSSLVPSADPLAEASPSPTAEQTYPPFPTPGIVVVVQVDPTPSELPYYPSLVADGWPVTLPAFTGLMTIGPDGTLYIDDYEPLSVGGRLLPTWMQLTDGSRGHPAAVGSDGTVYFQTPDDVSGDADPEQSLLWAFDASGTKRAGWPALVPPDSTVLAGPSGTAYVISQYSASPGVTILGPNGETRASWEISMPGGLCGQAIRPDGTLFIASSSDESAIDCSIRVFSATGHELTSSPTRGWNRIAMAEDGTVVAVGYDLEPYGAYDVAQTRVAIIGRDGAPAPGWPVAFEGTASGPGFGPDGTVYIARLGLGTSPSTITALDKNGQPKAGWPVSLPSGYGPLGGARPPVVGADGTVYCLTVNRAGTGYVLAFDAAGVPVPGWPYQLPAALAMFEPMSPFDEPMNPGPLYARTPGGGLLYLVLEDRIVALDQQGRPVPGWPRILKPGEGSWTYALTTPDGGVVTVRMAMTEEGGPAWLVERLTAAGQAPK